MSIAALIAWIGTAASGFVLLGTWIAKDGLSTPHTSHFPPAVIFGHFAPRRRRRKLSTRAP